jgi:hypothetical protein
MKSSFECLCCSRGVLEYDLVKTCTCDEAATLEVKLTLKFLPEILPDTLDKRIKIK